MNDFTTARNVLGAITYKLLFAFAKMQHQCISLHWSDETRVSQSQFPRFSAGTPILVDPRYAPDFPPTHPARGRVTVCTHTLPCPHTCMRAHTRTCVFSVPLFLALAPSQHILVLAHTRTQTVRVHADIVRADAYARRDGERRTMAMATATAVAAVVQPGGAEYRRTDRCVPGRRQRTATTGRR